MVTVKKRRAQPDTGLAVPTQRVPGSTARFVGREEELSDILHRVQDPECRLLTLARSLSIALEMEIPPHIAGATFYLANVLVAESEQFDDAAVKAQKQAMALTLLTLILRDPRCWQFLRDRATDFATRLRSTLSSKVVSEVEKRVAQTTLEELAAEILNAEKRT